MTAPAEPAAPEGSSAAPVVAVERDAATAAVARGNVARLGLDVRVVTASVETFLAESAPRPFDVVWLDPPYALGSDAVARVVALLVGRGWLARDGLVVVERATRDEAPVWPPTLPTAWSRRYGETTLYLASSETA